MDETEGETCDSQESELPVEDHSPGSTTPKRQLHIDTNIPITPPTAPGVIPQVRPDSSWPGIIGIIALVIGIFSFIGNLWGLVAPIFMNNTVSPMMGMNQPIYSKTSTYIIIGVSGVKSVMAIFLLYVGARILQRNRRARKLVIRYCLLDIVIAVVASILTGIVQVDTMQRTASSINTSGTMAVAGALIGVLLAVAFPVFLLIWFNRKAIRRETAEWT